MKQVDFLKHLKKYDCYLLREGGNHSIWANKANGKKSSVPRHKELSNMLCKVVCKQLEIPTPDHF